MSAHNKPGPVGGEAPISDDTSDIAFAPGAGFTIPGPVGFSPPLAAFSASNGCAAAPPSVKKKGFTTGDYTVDGPTTDFRDCHFGWILTLVSSIPCEELFWEQW